MNDSSTNLTSLEMLSCVECFVLLHSPFIIDMKELEEVHSKVHKNIMDDEMEYDIYTQEMSDFSPPLRLLLDAFLRWKTIHSLG
jgi:hypothetical protein